MIPLLRTVARGLLALLCLAAPLLGCASKPLADVPTTRARSYDPGQLARARRITLGGGRYYYLFDPSSPEPAAIPLVLVLHGLHEEPSSIASDSRFTSYAAAHNFAVAYGVGLARAWNAGSCCHQSRSDDIGYLINVVNDAKARLKVDARRIYVVGFSNGGMMALRAVCERPDVFAAAGVMAGALVTPCVPARGIRTRPVYVRQLHGLSDRTLPVRGGHNRALGLDVPALKGEARRLPRGSDLVLTVIPRLGHAWATAANSRVDATAVLYLWLSHHLLQRD